VKIVKRLAIKGWLEQILELTLWDDFDLNVRINRLDGTAHEMFLEKKDLPVFKEAVEIILEEIEELKKEQNQRHSFDWVE
jgi:hypothetical protein